MYSHRYGIPSSHSPAVEAFAAGMWRGRAVVPFLSKQYVKRVNICVLELLPQEVKKCDQFLRHKSLLLEPHFFTERNIPIYTVRDWAVYHAEISKYLLLFLFQAEQKYGDLMITFPNAHHYGFNNGFNVAEARYSNRIQLSKHWPPFTNAIKILPL